MKTERMHAELMVKYAQDASLKCWKYWPDARAWKVEAFPDWNGRHSFFVGREEPTETPRSRMSLFGTGVWFEVPLDEAPPEETEVYMAHVGDLKMYHNIWWNSKDSGHQLLLKRNLLFYKVEDAVACAKAMLKLIENDS